LCILFSGVFIGVPLWLKFFDDISKNIK
jgi:hypothetical protein